jgi:site-specific recombinase XerD
MERQGWNVVNYFRRYVYRHSFATDAPVNGFGMAQVAELIGHTSTEMVMKHYSHIAGNVTHMREAAGRAA